MRGMTTAGCGRTMPNSSSPSSPRRLNRIFVLFRLVRTLVFLVLILAVLGVVGFVVGRAVRRALAARSIEDRVGTPVSVSIATSVRPGVLRGDIGNVTVRAKQFEHNGLQAGRRTGRLPRRRRRSSPTCISGDVRLRYASVDFQGDPDRSALAAYLRPLLASRGLPSKKLRVHDHEGHGDALIGKQHAVMGAGSSDVVVQARAAQRLGGAGQRAHEPIQLGPLFDGVPPHRHRAAHGPRDLTGRGGPARSAPEPRCVSGVEHGARGEVLADLALDALERVVDGLRIAVDELADLLVGAALEIQREHAALERRQAGAEAADERRELLGGDDPARRIVDRRAGQRIAEREVGAVVVAGRRVAEESAPLSGWCLCRVAVLMAVMIWRVMQSSANERNVVSLSTR